MKNKTKQDISKNTSEKLNNFPHSGGRGPILVKIAILGIGGVGGYFGGKLARKYDVTNEFVKIYFIARGEHLLAIKKNGLDVITDDEEFTAFPTLATDKPAEIGICDFLIITTKSYDLKSSIENIKPCIGENTVILPLLNGGNISEKIREILPTNNVWDGLSYIVSRKTAPGIIRTSGIYHKMTFGNVFNDEKRLESFEKLVKDAEIDGTWSKDIRKSVWQKFYFISVSASLTSYFDVSFNDIVTQEGIKEFTEEFADEFLQVAQSEGVNLDEKDKQDVMKRLRALPEGSTASMHSDFLQGKNTEVETLTGEIVRLAHKHHLQVPLYEKVYDKLSKNMPIG